MSFFKKILQFLEDYRQFTDTERVTNRRRRMTDNHEDTERVIQNCRRRMTDNSRRYRERVIQKSSRRRMTDNSRRYPFGNQKFVELE